MPPIRAGYAYLLRRSRPEAQLRAGDAEHALVRPLQEGPQSEAGRLGFRNRGASAAHDSPRLGERSHGSLSVSHELGEPRTNEPHLPAKLASLPRYGAVGVDRTGGEKAIASV